MLLFIWLLLLCQVGELVWFISVQKWVVIQNCKWYESYVLSSVFQYCWIIPVNAAENVKQAKSEVDFVRWIALKSMYLQWWTPVTSVAFRLTIVSLSCLVVLAVETRYFCQKKKKKKRNVVLKMIKDVRALISLAVSSLVWLTNWDVKCVSFVNVQVSWHRQLRVIFSSVLGYSSYLRSKMISFIWMSFLV